MSIMHNILTSPTKFSAVVMTILVLFLFAIRPADDTMFYMGYVFLHVIPIMVFAMIFEICCARRVREEISAYNDLMGCNELRHREPSSAAFTTRVFQELKHEIALLRREIYELENFTLRGLPSNIFRIPYMTEEEINVLRVHNYKDIGLEREVAPPTQASSSSGSIKQGIWTITMMDEDRSCDALICNVCLEQIVKGDLVHSLACLHQFHSKCIDPWLGLNGCPVCKMDCGRRNAFEMA